MSLVTMEDFEKHKQLYTTRYNRKGKGNAKLAYALSRLSSQERGETCEHLIAAQMEKRGWESRVTAHTFPYDINSYKNDSRLRIEVKSALIRTGNVFMMQHIRPWHNDGSDQWDVLIMCCICPINGVVVRAAHHSDVEDFCSDKTPTLMGGIENYTISINKHYNHKWLDLYEFDDIIKPYEQEYKK